MAKAIQMIKAMATQEAMGNNLHNDRYQIAQIHILSQEIRHPTILNAIDDHRIGYSRILNTEENSGRTFHLVVG